MRPQIRYLLQLLGFGLVFTISLQTLTAAPATPIVPVERPLLETIDAKAVARELLTAKQFKCLDRLFVKESQWNPKSDNPKSTAVGIGQLLDGTYKNLGMKHSEAEVPQLVAALAYISRHYGSGGPCAAWAHFKAKHWY
ncbi:Transglycosylase SLT domain 1 [uncultured Caudovirales phage]|uniref:Transglycosylase SLT domain 1 n=1 Tax=uncultured Caudovirales phage TaxID=2100421 RepID=A0A6J5Q6G1_9CAUD|nr:Transglycosylase SLT domain 1 [uncultured Caudovirales phage]CAB4202716.1 Transglycosylase SLT domain 1 [uncultured Caudovirales phage]CAB4214084.1 Transglycosylase SLT domain 1 [uncultured Caudovirales phage]CAB5228674.1 Transglycosylase SLT domain 1 [uncultured Caudovirales phage]